MDVLSWLLDMLTGVARLVYLIYEMTHAAVYLTSWLKKEGQLLFENSRLHDK